MGNTLPNRHGRMVKERRSAVLPYVCLATLFLSAIAFQARITPDVIRGEKVDVPAFQTDPASDVLSFVSSAARSAGMRVGDKLLAVNGQPYTGTAVLADAVARAQPGKVLLVKVTSDGAASRTLQMPVTKGASGAGKIALDVLVDIFMPSFCILVGAWVVLVRPRDRSAWLLFGLLLGFAHLLHTNKVQGWGPGWCQLGMVYDNSLASLWAPFMFLFGFFFPEPFPFWKTAGALKRMIPVAVCLPLALNGLITVVVSTVDLTNFRAVASLNLLTQPFQQFAQVYAYVVVGAFFGFIFTKSSMPIPMDARRRLRLLYWGTTIAMTPGLIYAVASAIMRKPGYEVFPEWVGTTALLLLMLFPITLAYVIVVQRAMDVRVALRQGLQYGLATRGIRVIQIVILSAVVAGLILATGGKQMSGAKEIAAIAAGVVLVIVVRQAGDKVKGWIDRRFFREAYNAEQVLSELSDQVRSLMETRPLIETVAARIADTLHVPRVAVLLSQGGAYTPAYAHGYGEVPKVLFPRSGGTVQALGKRLEPARVYLDDPDSWLYRDPGIGDLDRSQLATLDAELLLPLSARERLLGFISLGPKLSDEPYSGTDVRLLNSVAAQTGLALENARLMSAIAEEVAQRERLNREVEIAREVQERLFPQTLPPIEGLEYAGACRPALGVGGDYYDFLALPGGKLGIAIGDVSGKGIAAALMMASLQASLRGEATRASDDLATMIANVNRLVFEASQSNRYATFFYGQYNPATRTMTYVNAGHNPPFILRKIGNRVEVTRLDTTGTVVGLLEHFPYEQAACSIEPGDLFVAFTDGISEAMNNSDEEWGEERLLTSIENSDGATSNQLISQIMRDADAFVNGAKQHDDMTLVVLRCQLSR